MTSLYVRRPKVKPTRRSARPPAPFAAGLPGYAPLPPEPSAPAMPRPVRVTWRTVDVSPLDEGPSDTAWDRLAGEALAVDRHERGVIPGGVAERIAETSLIGHDS